MELTTWLLVIYFHGAASTADMFATEEDCNQMGHRFMEVMKEKTNNKAKDYGFICVNDADGEVYLKQE